MLDRRPLSEIQAAFRRLRADWMPARFTLRTGRLYRSVPGTIELDGPAAERQQMFEQVARCWQQLGEQEPYWSVLTSPKFQMSRIGSTGDEFYRSGQACLSTIEAFFARSRQPIENVKTVLEFGCGVGRETIALASRLTRVVGVDARAACTVGQPLDGEACSAAGRRLRPDAPPQRRPPGSARRPRRRPSRHNFQHVLRTERNRTGSAPVGEPGWADVDPQLPGVVPVARTTSPQVSISFLMNSEN